MPLDGHSLRVAFLLGGLASAALVACNDPLGGPQGGLTYVDTIQVYGIIPRSYRVHLPRRAVPPGAPLLLAFHGFGIDAARMESHTGLSAVAEREDVVVAYPESFSGAWISSTTGQDLEFTTALIDRLVASHRVDPNRVLVVGLSNGAEFVQFLGCEIPNRIVGFVAVSATMSWSLETPCVDGRARFPGGRSVTARFMLGTADPHYPLTATLSHMGADASIAFWRQELECGPEHSSEQRPDTSGDGTTAFRTRYASCRPCTFVQLDSLVGGGHGWPGALLPIDTAFVGVTSRAISANEEVIAQLLATPCG